MSENFNALVINQEGEKFSREIKKIDKSLAWFEAVDLAGYKEKEASKIIKKPKLNSKPQIIVALSVNDVQKKFLKRFQEII